MPKLLGELDPNSVHSFEQHKPNILTTLKKLILKDRVSKDEWQNLFHDVHMVCSWDPQGPEKLLRYFRKELYETYVAHIKSKLKGVEDGTQLLKGYVKHWNDFKKHCHRLPIAFQQLDLATRDALYRGAFHSKTNPPVIKISNQMIYSRFGGTRKDTSKTLPNNTYKPKLPINKNGCPYSTVRCLMLKMWADEVINPLVNRLFNTTHEFLFNERLGRLDDSSLIVGLRESFSYLDELRIIDYQQCHVKIFEQIYVECVRLFYSTVGSPDKCLRDNGLLGYINWALNKFEREEMKAHQYLEADSLAIQGVSDTCREVLIENFVEQLYPAAVQLIRTDKVETIQLIYRFFTKNGSVVQRLFDEDFRHHIVSTGLAYLRNSDTLSSGNQDQLVEKLMDVYEKFHHLVEKGFNRDTRAEQALEQAMSSLVNNPEIFSSKINNADQSLDINTPSKSNLKSGSELKISEVLANYLNHRMRKRYGNSMEVDEGFWRFYAIVGVLKNKEAFIKMHKYHLTRRLVLDVTACMVTEEEIIHEIRKLPGMPVDEINELLRMFKDVETSEELNEKFLKSMKPTLTMESVNNNNTISNITSQITDRLSIRENDNHFSPVKIKVLNPSAWTTNLERNSMLILPNQITSLMPFFDTFYRNHYDGREIDWCHQLSNGVITFRNISGYKYDLEVTSAQLSVLNAFDEKPYGTKNLDELHSLTNLSNVELRRTLRVSL